MYLLLTLIAFIGTLTAAYTDFKHDTIPNILTLPLILSGLILHLLYGLYINNLSPFYLATLGTGGILIFFIGILMGRGLSAGDIKVFMFIAALVPSFPDALHGIFAPLIAPYPFIFSVCVNTILLSSIMLIASSRVKEKVSYAPFICLGFITALSIGDIFYLIILIT